MASEPAETLIGGRYAVGKAPAPYVAPALAAVTCEDRKGGAAVMALRVTPFLPPRARALLALGGRSHPGMLAPLEYGSTGSHAYVVCEAAPGTPLSERRRPWSETDIVRLVLRPIAATLEVLASRQVTHQAIRLDNIFRGEGGRAVLGPAWAAPPGSAQPAVYMPPYMAACLHAGRGEGSIADDVYALGVVLLALALDRLPLEDLDDAAIIGRKLELGSHAALVGDARLPPVIAELVAGMLAEDPEHRPSPALLLDLGAARNRRVATAAPRRAAAPFDFAGRKAWTARGLAHTLATNPGPAMTLLRTGAVETWLRRDLQDSKVLARVDGATRNRAARSQHQADPMLLMRTVALLDPLAPLCWREALLWPDGLGPAVARARDPAVPSSLGTALEELVAAEATLAWSEARSDRPVSSQLRHEARDSRTLLALRGPAGGLERLAYALNPLMPCASPLLAGHVVVRPAELLPALETVAGARTDRTHPPVDRSMAAFLAAREESRVDQDAVQRIDWINPQGISGQLMLLAGLQARLGPDVVPGVAKWLSECGLLALKGWKGRSTRGQVTARLAELVESGDLRHILALLEDVGARERDRLGLEQAQQQVARIDAELAQLQASVPGHAEAARRIGHEVAAGLGLLAGAVATVLAVLL